jgi:hypothetical protein
VLALIPFAAEETSKTPYYVAAGALAVFAVIVSAIGIRGHETFPPSKAASRVVMLVCALIVAATMASAVLTG